MQAREQALEREITAQMTALSVLAEAAESGQEGAEAAGLERVREVERLQQMLEVERARAEMPRGQSTPTVGAAPVRDASPAPMAVPGASSSCR